MTRFTTVVMLVVAAWTIGWSAAASPASAAEVVVDPKGGAAGETLNRALASAKAGDIIVLGSGEYPAVVIGKTYDKPLTIRAAKGARPLMTGGLAVRSGGGVRVSGLVFTWAAGRRPRTGMTPFIEIASSKDVEVAECEIFDDPKLTEWVGWACSVNGSERVTVRDTKAHHFYFGFSAYQSKDVIFRNLTIGPWSHEDALRATECDGPILIEGCRISNAVVAGTKTGHCDAIQVVHWTDNLTVRNCYMSGVAQGFGAFATERRRKNWHFEGNVVYDVYAPHVCSILSCDGVTVINNTFPQNRPIVSDCTAAVVKNNIIGAGTAVKGESITADYNLYITGRDKGGEHDLVGVDPKFANAPLLTLRSDNRRLKEMTRSKFFIRESLTGRLAVGDIVEVLNSDGSARDAKPRKVTGVGPDWLEIDKPIDNNPDWAGVVIYKWPAGAKSLVPDYHLKPDSPAIDSADSSVKRTRDLDGHEPTDVRTVPNTGTGPVKYLDRGAFELAPDK